MNEHDEAMVDDFLDHDERDPDEEDGDDFECGRWRNGRLVTQCLKAGPEECDWDCPIGVPR